MNAIVSLVAKRVRRICRAYAAVTTLALVLQRTAVFAEDASPVPVPATTAATNPAAMPTPAPTPNFEFVDGVAVTLAPDAFVKFKIDILIKNSGGLAGVPSLELVRDMENRCDPRNLTLNPKNLDEIQPKGVSITHAALSDVKLPAICYIKLTAGNPAGNTSWKQIKLNQEYLTKDVFHPLVAAAVLAAIVAMVTGGVARRRIGAIVGANYRLGSPAWELDKSWISNTTVVSSVLATAMGLGSLPELTKYASKTGYAALIFMTSLAVIIAPFLSTAFRRGDVKKDDKNNSAVVYGTCVWLFLVCGAVTLFAGITQVVVLFLLFDEIFLPYGFWSIGSEPQPWTSFNLGILSTAVLVVALCWYVSHSMFLTIRLQVQSEGQTGFRAGFAVDNATASQRPPWPVL
jgi:hypothetical protein